MAEAAGIYGQVWRPEENGIKTGADMLPHLERGIAALLADPSRFEALNPDNGWGSYEGFLKFLRRYREACEDRPNDAVGACR
jgi:hypothetical protein